MYLLRMEHTRRDFHRLLNERSGLFKWLDESHYGICCFSKFILTNIC
jgi:hypothetical protein